MQSDTIFRVAVLNGFRVGAEQSEAPASFLKSSSSFVNFLDNIKNKLRRIRIPEICDDVFSKMNFGKHYLWNKPLLPFSKTIPSMGYLYQLGLTFRP